MNKKISALILAVSLLIAVIPAAFAANSDFIGTYYTNNTDGTGGATLEIRSCTDTSVTVSFKRVKDDVERYTYTFSEGVMNGSEGTVQFHAVMNTGSEFDGTMSLTLLNSGMVKIDLVSSLGASLYKGTLPRISTDVSGNGTSNGTGNTSPATPPPSVPSYPTPPAPDMSTNVFVNVNGTPVSFADTAKPVIINDSTYVPLRSVLRRMGINVFWDEYNKTDLLREQLITCTLNGTVVQFSRTLNYVGQNSWSLKKYENELTNSPNGSYVDISDVQPVIINDRAYIPLRVVSESFGAAVNWIDEERLVDIICDDGNITWIDDSIIPTVEGFTSEMAREFIPAGYTSVVPNIFPCYASNGKCYLFTASDEWNTVILRIYYNGRVEVIPSTEPAYYDISYYEQPDNAAPADENTGDTSGTDTEDQAETDNQTEPTDDTASDEEL